MKRVGQLFREKLVNAIKDGVNNNSSVFLLSYSQLSGQNINDFRKDLNKAGANVCAAKNNIALLALKDIKQESLAALQTAIDGGNATFVTQIETSYSTPSKVSVSLKVPREADEIELLPLFAIEDSIPTLQ